MSREENHFVNMFVSISQKGLVHAQHTYAVCNDAVYSVVIVKPMGP